MESGNTSTQDDPCSMRLLLLLETYRLSPPSTGALVKEILPNYVWDVITMSKNNVSTTKLLDISMLPGLRIPSITMMTCS